jgi:uncharacterized protein YkwD
MNGPRCPGSTRGTAIRVLRPTLVAALLVAAVIAQAPPAVPRSGPPTEPTAHETEVLCWINRFRRDPQAFGRLVVDGNRPFNADQVDWAMFTAEIAALAPAPPVFFDARLIDASRAHARYTIENREYGHRETRGKPGFTGEWPHERAHAAGYRAIAHECACARSSTPLEIVAGNVVDADFPGRGKGNMQDPRGHRLCLIDPKWRDAGVGLFAWGDAQLSNVLLFSDGVADGVRTGRVLGGVALDDRDGDAFYDAGEGLGGVHVSAGGVGTLTSASGAWRLDLTRDGKPAKLVARLGSLELTRDVPAGTDNALIDLQLDVRRAIADLEAQLARVPDTATAQQRALRLQLLELRAPASPAEQEAADELARRKAPALALLGTGTRTEVLVVLRAAKRDHARTVAERWFAQAETVDGLLRDAAVVRAMRDSSKRDRQARIVSADIDRALAATTHADLWQRLAAVRRELLGL